METNIVREKIIIEKGKPVYAINLNEEKGLRNHIYIHNGEIYFSDRWVNEATEFDCNDEAHKLAKEIFKSQIGTDIKRRILELKLLEAIFDKLGIKEYITDTLNQEKKRLFGLSSAKKVPLLGKEKTKKGKEHLEVKNE